jgi:glycosyltransferase involved in cell wall biosynthesis
MLRAELANDPHAGYRKAARIGCWMLACATSVVFLEHGWGGGAEAAVSDAVEQASHSGACCIRLRAIKSGVRIEFVFGDESEVFDSVPPDLVLKLIAAIRPASLEIHGLHSMSAPHATLREILASLTARTRVDIFLHDFFVVCPSQHLINWRGSYCGVPDISICNICLPRNPNVSTYAPSLNRWRKSWKELFERVDSVIVFDESAIPILKSAFRAEELPMIVIRPPAYEAPSPGAIRQEAGALRRIAFCGAVLHHKGAAVVRALADYVFDHGLDIKLVLIGELLDGKPPPHNLEITGQYESRRLVNILSEQEINIVVFPSICPETFSFTLSEIFASGLPCVGLDIGAQGHRLREYPKGIVLPNLAPKPLLDAMEVYFAKNEK